MNFIAVGLSLFQAALLGSYPVRHHHLALPLDDICRNQDIECVVNPSLYVLLIFGFVSRLLNRPQFPTIQHLHQLVRNFLVGCDLYLLYDLIHAL